MSDSDDSGPLSQQVKKRRKSYRPATGADRDSVSVDVGADTNHSPAPVFSNREELAAMIAELRTNIIAKMRETQHQASSTDPESDRLQCALSKQEAECRDLQARLASKREELELTKLKLISLGSRHESSREATSRKERMLAQALVQIQELEKLAQELPARLQKTAFESKDSSIMVMLGSFYRDILQKYSGTGGTELPDATRSSPSIPQELDEDTKEKLGSVLHGLRTHEYYQTFACPVTEDVAPGYFEFIKNPMDLSTLRRKLESDKYSSLSGFIADATLMFNNCHTYNVNSRAYRSAANSFEKQMRLLMERRGLGWN